MDKLMEILQELRPDVDFENETALIRGAIIDKQYLQIGICLMNDALNATLNIRFHFVNRHNNTD